MSGFPDETCVDLPEDCNIVYDEGSEPIEQKFSCSLKNRMHARIISSARVADRQVKRQEKLFRTEGAGTQAPVSRILP